MTISENIYEGDFNVTKDMVNNGRFIEGKIPRIVNGDFICSVNNLTSLKFCPEIVNGNFNCYNNKLTSLEFRPVKVNGNFNCYNNKLTSLEFCPEEVKGYFDCSNNRLNSLEFGPKQVNKSIWCSGNVNDLEIEKEFIKSGMFKNDYYKDLLDYIISNNIDIKEVESWPKGFLSKNLKRSIKGKNKFNL